MAEHIARGEQEMLATGAVLARVLRAGDVLALSGGLGAGKTTLARGLLAALGLEEEAPSPTFAIVQPYGPPEVSLPVVHVDLYRLDDPAEVDELGLNDYLLDSALVVEWPERMGERFWPDALLVKIEVLSDGARRLTASLPPSWKERWPFR
jgi:tRNA threonylcarbamoyladenosine biosynthesis protein TsaE